MVVYLDAELSLYSGLNYSGSLANMRRLYWINQLSLPVTTTLTNADLRYMFLAAKLGTPDTKLTRADMESLLDIAGGFANIDSSGLPIVLEITNLATNPGPLTAVTGWSTNDGVNYPVTYSSGEIQITRGIGASGKLLAWTVGTAGVFSQILPLGISYQRCIEIKSPVNAHVVASTLNRFSAQPTLLLPAGIWTRVTESFLGTNTSSYNLSLRIEADVDPGSVSIVTSLRRAMLVQAPASPVLAYADGDSPGWHWNGAVGNSTSSGPATDPMSDPVRYRALLDFARSCGVDV